MNGKKNITFVALYGQKYGWNEDLSADLYAMFLKFIRSARIYDTETTLKTINPPEILLEAP